MSEEANTKTLELRHPVEVGGTRTETLAMRRPKVRDSKDSTKAGGTPAEQEIRLFANLCEVAPDLIEELDMGDYARLQELYTDFVSGR